MHVTRDEQQVGLDGCGEEDVIRRGAKRATAPASAMLDYSVRN